MGYSTDYKGKVAIKPEATIKNIREIKNVIATNSEDMKWNLQVSEDMEFIEWRGCEKTYNFELTLNELIKEMRNRGFNDFDLEGEFKYQGEEMDDRGYVRKIDGEFKRVEIGISESECKCPNCGYIFNLEQDLGKD